ncbi:MAG: 16S rRNA (cytosine(1402)-N(4))-methyltransferase RsmH [Desulfotomaculum sp.]|nr:16S rRNA (cytosine(1402)-N(4))-methyltransferase RsmH [Desulfotomaculum sp.]
MNFDHIPVLLEEVIAGLKLKPGGVYLDCTLGGAGHAYQILQCTTPDGKLIGLDHDPVAVSAATKRLLAFEQRVTIVQASFTELATVLKKLKATNVNGVLFDLGVSSPQLDDPQRGFSYRYDAPLDMRMNPANANTAQQVINTFSEAQLTAIIQDYGEEKWAKRIASFIVKERQNKPVSTTFELVEIIKKAIPAAARRSGPHPAKRTFQAIRIAVNDELNILKNAFIQAVQVLQPGGRIAVITFHSLEDRITKELFKYLALDCICPPKLPVCNCNKKREIKIINRKPVEPSRQEIERNRRARSAKLRIAEKL